MTNIVQRIAMKGVVVQDGKVLILREAATYGDGTQRGRYHMPGGRLEAGENFEEALRREIMEETGLEVEIEYPIYVGEWRPVIRDVPHQIVATYFVCTPKSDAKSDAVVLSTEHDDYQWILPADRRNFDVMDPENKVIDRYAEWQQNFKS